MCHYSWHLSWKQEIWDLLNLGKLIAGEEFQTLAQQIAVITVKELYHLPRLCMQRDNGEG